MADEIKKLSSQLAQDPDSLVFLRLAEQLRHKGQLDGVVDVQSTMTFTPPWTPELMSEDAKFALGF